MAHLLKRHTLSRVVLLLGGLAMLWLPLNAQGAEPEFAERVMAQTKLTASSRAALDVFGAAVAVSADGNTVAIGAEGMSSKFGAVYVYVKPGGGWSGNLTEAAKLTASDGAANDYFGAAVAVSADGNLIAIGAKGHDSSQGQVYLFHKPVGGWSGNLTENVKLKVAGGLTGDGLGGTLAISGEASIIVAGATGVDVNSRSGQGAAYVFVAPLGGWSPDPTLCLNGCSSHWG